MLFTCYSCRQARAILVPPDEISDEIYVVQNHNQMSEHVIMTRVPSYVARREMEPSARAGGGGAMEGVMEVVAPRTRGRACGP